MKPWAKLFADSEKCTETKGSVREAINGLESVKCWETRSRALRRSSLDQTRGVGGKKKEKQEKELDSDRVSDAIGSSERWPSVDHENDLPERAKCWETKSRVTGSHRFDPREAVGGQKMENGETWPDRAIWSDASGSMEG
jgi:hypothetical protein